LYTRIKKFLDPQKNFFWVRLCLKLVFRQVVTLNIGGKIISPINKPAYGQVTVNYRYGTIYRQVLDTHPIEWCGIMDIII